MELLSIIYSIYMFIAIYFLSFYTILYLKNRKYLLDCPKMTKHYSLSVLIPVYNEEDVLEGTLNSVINSDYDNIKEIIIVNDGSKDKTLEVAKKLAQKYKIVRILDKANSGKADSLNQAIKIAKGELIAVVDSDSFHRPDSISKLIGFFDDPKVGAATCPVIARNREKFIEELQAIEYALIAVGRKLLECVGAVYVTPGPLAMYRKTALLDIGGFDPKNMTEDIEATWHLAANGWERKMCLDTRVSTIVPSRLATWFKQRQRCSMGGMQIIWKYKSYFLKKGIVGLFLIPFFSLSLLLGLVGLCVFSYLMITKIIKEYLIIKMSFITNTSFFTPDNFYFVPSILNYIGALLLIVGAIYTLSLLFIMEEDIFKRRKIIRLIVYMLFYSAAYPLIMITAIYKLIIRDMRW